LERNEEKKNHNDERGGIREGIQMDAKSSGEPKGMEHQSAMQHSKDKRVALFPLCAKSLLFWEGFRDLSFAPKLYHSGIVNGRCKCEMLVSGFQFNK
jgi:hypothetical protein